MDNHFRLYLPFSDLLLIRMCCQILLVVVLCIGSCWGGLLTKHSFNSSALLYERTVVSPTPKYYGCFNLSGLGFQQFQTNANNDNGVCQKYCKEGGHMFSATHKDVCGCFSKHPRMEVSGPSHGTDTVRVTKDGKKCNSVCPAKKGVSQCNEPNCCGGEDSIFTVYQVGGIKKSRCSPALMKELEKKGVDIEKSNLPTQCLEPASKRNLAEDNGISLEAASLKPDDDCDVDYDNMPHPWACCSPDCDWLVVYMCIDGTVIKCLDK